ncbi:MAG: hypothetical protein JWL85_262 [Candidatus Saccharibacteria bacterium]|nr:hypothetical protein [Candidatus Saccharibacteria bacterium]
MTKAEAAPTDRKPMRNVLLGILGLGLTYAIASRAIDTGSIAQYLLTIVLLGTTINMFIGSFKK